MSLYTCGYLILDEAPPTRGHEAGGVNRTLRKPDDRSVAYGLALKKQHRVFSTKRTLVRHHTDQSCLGESVATQGNVR